LTRASFIVAAVFAEKVLPFAGLPRGVGGRVGLAFAFFLACHSWPSWGRCGAARGRLSDDQKDIIDRLRALGHSYAVVRSIDDARRELARLGIVTRERASA